MSMLTQSLTQVATVSLLGTGRSPLTSLPADGLLGQALGSVPTTDNQLRLLNSSALVYQYKRCGVNPLPFSGSLDDPAPVSTMKNCSNRVAEIQQQLISGDSQLFEELLTLMARSNQCVNYLILPEFLDYGWRHPQMQDKIRRVIGERGQWLAKQNLAWSWATLDGDLDIADWMTGETNERLKLLSHIRRDNPSNALDLINSTWQQDPAKERAKFVKALEIGLSETDEPFLENALDDRSSEVKFAAQYLLIQMPTSRLSQRALNCAVEFLNFKRSLLYGLQPQVTIPESYLPDWKRDGIEETTWIQEIGNKTWWFVQLIGRVPPEHWSKLYNSSPDLLFKAAAQTEWADALRIGWTMGSNVSKDPEWIYAVLKYWATSGDRRVTISRIIPGIARLGTGTDAFLLDLLTADTNPLYSGHPAMQPLMQATHQLQAPLARALIDSIRRRSAIPDLPNINSWQCQTILSKLAYLIPPELADELTADWPVTADNWERWRPTFDVFSDTIHFRKDLHEEFSQL